MFMCALGIALARFKVCQQLSNSASPKKRSAVMLAAVVSSAVSSYCSVYWVYLGFSVPPDDGLTKPPDELFPLPSSDLERSF